MLYLLYNSHKNLSQYLNPLSSMLHPYHLTLVNFHKTTEFPVYDTAFGAMFIPVKIIPWGTVCLLIFHNSTLNIYLNRSGRKMTLTDNFIIKLEIWVTLNLNKWFCYSFLYCIYKKRYIFTGIYICIKTNSMELFFSLFCKQIETCFQINQ